MAYGAVSDGPVSDGPVSDGPVSDGPVSDGPVRLRYFDGHVEVELAAAARGNPLAPGLVEPLLAALEAAAGNPDCRAVLISAAGPHFCRGLDLGNVPAGWYAEPGRMPPWRLFELLHTVPLVTVALVDGQATGGGVALAAACDLVIAGQAASFRFTELLLGLVPAMALPFVANRVGVQHAYRMALTACALSPGEAAGIGLADLVYPRAADGARPVLMMARRTTPDTVRALKRLRDQLFPQPPGLAAAAGSALIERLRDPAVLARIDGFRSAGTLG